MRRAGRRTVLLAAALAVPGNPLLGQETWPPPPPDPGPPPPVDPRPVMEDSLPSGLRFLVVPEREVPLATVTLAVPGGRAADRPGEEGTARVLAELMDGGQVVVPGGSISGRLADLGGELSVTAAEEWIVLSLTALSDEVDGALALLAELALRPAFPDPAVRAAAEGLAVRMEAGPARAALAADRAFLAAVYGDHPLGRVETPESLRSVDPDDVRRHHEAWFRPRGAWVAVAGDVEPERVSARVSDVFGGWSDGEPGGDTPAPGAAPPFPPEGPRIVVVHRPGAASASLRIGTALVGGDHPDWPALTLIERILGGGPDARVPRALRLAGAGSAVATEARRLGDWGFFRVSAEVETGAARAAVGAVLGALRELGSGFLPPGELARTRGGMVGRHPIEVETAHQLAARLLGSRLVGSGSGGEGTSPAAGLGPQDVRDAAAAHLDPDRTTVVVAGDARRLRGALLPLGEVTVVDVEGRPLGLEDVVAPASAPALDASALRPAALVYRVLVDGVEAGVASRTLRERGGVMELRAEAVVRGTRVEQSVTFGPEGFVPLAATAAQESSGTRGSLEVRVEGGRASGAVEAGGRRTPIDVVVPEGAVLADMTELAVTAAPLAADLEFLLSVVHPVEGAVEVVSVRVEGRETLTVPAGTFDTWRVFIDGSRPQRVWALVDRPHHLVRLAPVGVPLVMELTGIGRPPEGR